MISIVNLLILFFIILILYQLFLAHVYNIYEGFTNGDSYQDYDTTDQKNISILTYQNAGNIQFLKQQIDQLSGLRGQVQDLSGNLQTLQGQVQQIVLSQQNYATQKLGNTPPNITGAT